MIDINHRLNVRVNYFHDSIEASIPKKYYLSLKDYESDRDTKFFINNGLYKLAYVVWDTTKQNGRLVIEGHYEQKTIPIRYSKEEKKVLVPLTHLQYQIVSGAVFITVWLFIALSLYFFLGLPLQILIRISRGNAFTKANVKGLQRISLFLFISGLVATTFPHLMLLFFRKLIPQQLQLSSPIHFLFENRMYFFTAFIVFIISIAFKKGNQLQQEQNLII